MHGKMKFYVRFTTFGKKLSRYFFSNINFLDLTPGLEKKLDLAGRGMLTMRPLCAWEPGFDGRSRRGETVLMPHVAAGSGCRALPTTSLGYSP